MTGAIEPGRSSILLVDPDAAELYLPALRARFEVTAVSTQEQAIRALKAFRPTLVITELTLPGGDGVAVCCAAKAGPMHPPRVLVTTAAAERVPEALIAGCDGVLMKPHAPILLFMRISRLLQQRRDRQGGTNVVRDDEPCSSCGKGSIIAFDAASQRHMWYACLHCRHVWIALWREQSVRASQPISPISVPAAPQLGAS